MPGTRQVLEAKLASGFLGGAEVRAGNSSYYLIQEELALDFPPLVGQAQRLRRQLQLVRGIGPKTEARLREAGIDSLVDLLDTPAVRRGGGSSAQGN